MDTTILAGIADYEGAIERAVKTASDMLGTARDSLAILADSPYRDALRAVTDYLDALLAGCRGKV